MDTLSKADRIRRDCGLDRTLGVRYEKLDPGHVVAVMEITPGHLQPFGSMHGGATVALAESAASAGAYLACSPGQLAVGMEINANHLRPKREGLVIASARPVFVGRTTQVWEVHITGENDDLICIARCTLAVIKSEVNNP